MNRADVVTTAVEHAIPAHRLMMFADLAVSGWPHHRLAAMLTSYRPAEMVTGGAHLVADEAGITMTGLHGGEPELVTWMELTGYLSAVIATTHVEDLIDAYRGSLEDGDADAAHQRLSELRSGLAYDAVRTAGLIPASLFTDTLAERVIIDGPGDDGGFSGRVTLDPVDDNAVACRVNGAAVVVVSRAVELHRVIVGVHDGAMSGDRPGVSRVGFDAAVRHVPPGDSNAPLPAIFAQRVGAEVLDEDRTGARWAVQVDGFDVVIMEVGNAVAPVVRAAVYDNDPAQPFQRYEGHSTVPAAPPSPPRAAGAAVNRLAHLRRPPSPGPGR